jgi:ATP-dependent RNA helicase DHX8/PRP22
MQWRAMQVKVLSVAGNKVSLSMKEADQQTGEDLKPASAASTGANSIPLGGGGGMRNPDK